MQTLRLFIAIKVPPIRQQDIAAAFRKTPLHFAHYRPVASENIHLTIKFLGEIAVEKIPVIVDSLGRLSEKLLTPEIHLIGGISLPISQPKVLGIAIKPSQSLTQVYESIDVDLARQGVANLESRKFRPHLTLARVKKGMKLNQTEIDSIKNWHIDLSWPGDTLMLMESIREKKGPTYNILQSYSLQ